MPTRSFRLAPGAELVKVDDDRYTLRSEFDAVEMTGEATVEFAEKVLRELHLPRDMEDISALLPEYDPSSVIRQIEGLIEHGLVIEVFPSNDTSQPIPFTAFLEAIGLNSGETTARLNKARVAVFGLEAHGAHLAQMLAHIGVGHILLVDPFPLTESHLTLTPVTDRKTIGLSRQQALAAKLGLDNGRIEIGPTGELNERVIRKVIEGCDLTFSCWDQAYGTASHWLNQAAQKSDIPVLFGELRATATYAGPLVLPHRSACWMCYRMRSIACAKDFEQAIAFEEHLDRTRLPKLAGRPILPMLPNQLASIMGLEALRYLIGIHPPVLVDHVVEYDAIRNTTIEHPVLVKPDCPVCSKKKKRFQPPFDELITAESTSLGPSDLFRFLVGQRTGVISKFGAVPKDLTEPPIPLVWRATVSNHRFFNEYEEERAACSGKGISIDEAWISCLGEAIERYSGACWDLSELHVARHSELDGRFLDPRELVLYRDEQYEFLPYTPYDEKAELAWLKARSLIYGDEVWVPAIAALMDYSPRNKEEFLFPITSNGLAAGPSLNEALLNAISEVLERDAFLISWLHRLPGHPFKSCEHPDSNVRRLARLYKRRGIRLELIRLITDHPMCVFMGVALQDDSSDGPSASVGLGAAIDPVVAARKSALEVGQVRPSIRRRARLFDPKRMQELAANPLGVKTMEDHALLYAHPSTAQEFDFLFGEPQTWTEREPADSLQNLKTILGYFREVGQDVLYVNLTPPDMKKLGIYTVRAIVPGYQPIWFGRGERRLGGHRLFEFPIAQALHDAVLNPDELNPMPHPIA